LIWDLSRVQLYGIFDISVNLVLDLTAVSVPALAVLFLHFMFSPGSPDSNVGVYLR